MEFTRDVKGSVVMEQLRAIYQRTGYAVASFVLALGLVTAAVPFILSEGVTAAPAPAYTEVWSDVDLTQAELDANWTKDRQVPSAGYESVSVYGRDSVAQISIDEGNTHNNGFNRTEGIKTTFQGKSVSAVEADLYLDSDWQDSATRAGLWVRNDAATEGIARYAIIDFINSDKCDDCTSHLDNAPDTEFTGFRLWDSTVGWKTYLNTSFAYDSWVTLKIELNRSSQQFIYYINGTQVGVADASKGDGNGYIRNVHFNSYNYGKDSFEALSSEGYDAHWSNLSYAEYVPEASRIVSPSVDSEIVVGQTLKIEAHDLSAVLGNVSWAVRDDGKCNEHNATVAGSGRGSQSTWINGVFTASVDTTGWSGGDYCFVFNPADGRRLTQLFTVSPDTVAPEVSISINGGESSLPDGSTVGPNQQPFLVVSDLTLDRVEVSKATTDTHRPQANNPGVVNLNIKGRGNGTYTVVAYDKSNNQTTFTFTMDRNAPEVPVLTGPADETYVNGGPTLTWSHSNPADVDHYVYESYRDSELNSLVYATDKSGMSHKVGGTQDIVIWWRVAAVDAAGNQSDWSEVRKLTIDNTAPAVSISGVNGGEVYNAPVTVEGLVEDANHGHYWLSITKDGSPLNISGVTGTKSADKFTATFSEDGEYVIVFAARDLADNKDNNDSVETVSFTIDTTAPVITLVGDAEVTLTVGDTYTDLGATADDGSVVFVDDSLVDTSATGAYEVTYTATDAAGNVGTATRTVIVVAPAPIEQEKEIVEDEVVDEPLFPGGFTDELETNPDLTPETETQDAGEASLGATTENAAQAAGASEDASWLGLAWYWWVVIAGAIAAGAWWLFGAIRRRQGDAEA